MESVILITGRIGSIFGFGLVFGQRDVTGLGLERGPYFGLAITLN